MPQSISILIPTHNRVELLCQTLDSLLRVGIPLSTRVELIVVANACTDDTSARIAPLLAKMPMPSRLVEEPEPGLNPARNRCVVESTGEVCALLDDDVLIEPDWLVEMARAYDQTGADIIGGRVLLWWRDVEQPKWAAGFVQQILSKHDYGPEIREGIGGIGANFTFRRSVFDQLAGFRKGLDRTPTSLMGGGESEFMRRAAQAGLRIYYCGKATVHHYVAPNRLEPDYLRNVAKGLGRSFVYQKPTFGLQPAIRSIGIYMYLGMKGSVMSVVGTLFRRQTTRMDGILWRYVGMGGLRASYDRLRGRPPI